MLKCYADDSGSQPDAHGSDGHVFALAGYIMHESRWEDFAEKWYAELKRDFAIDYCRMSDAEAGEGQFAGMREEFRKRKVKDLALVVQECNPTALVCIMKWSDYNAEVQGKVDPRLDHPYAILFFQILKAIADLQIKFDEAHGFGFHPVDFIFDEQGSVGLKCLQWYAALRERLPEPHRTIIGNTPLFKDDREVVPLQAADMLAWHVHREYSHPEEQRDMSSLLSPMGLWVRDIGPRGLAQVVEVFNSDDYRKNPSRG